MKSLFYKMQTDKRLLPVCLENSVAGGMKSSCWLIGGGPSFTAEMAAIIDRSPAPRMCINLAGTGLIRPNYWTSYDPTERFLKSIYLDSSVIKFVHQRRGMDLVPESTYKVCESPQLYVFTRDGKQDFNNFLSHEHQGIVDWQDSMVQGIDILYRLGFRRIFLAGCEMRVRPDPELLAFAETVGVYWQDTMLLHDFVKECQQNGLTRDQLSAASNIKLYHFDERK